MTNIETALTRTLGFGVEEFVKKELEGGGNLAGHYKNDEGLGYPAWKYEDGHIYFTQTVIGFGGDPARGSWKVSIAEILLNPASWRAVGKVEGWDTGKAVKQFVPAHTYRTKKGKEVHIKEVVRTMRYKGDPFVWKKNMHRFIDTLCELSAL